MSSLQTSAEAASNEQGTRPHNQENEDPDGPDALRKMFYEGINNIGIHKSENLFEALEKRTLTEAEQSVIEERVALQRKMFELFERQEKGRKINELLEVCPDISQLEAERALELCDGREDEAAAALASDPLFIRRVKIAAGTLSTPSGPPGQARSTYTTANRARQCWAARPTGARPKVVDPSTLGDSVFVGTFRGKGFQGLSARGGNPSAKWETRNNGGRRPSRQEAIDDVSEEENDPEHQERDMETDQGEEGVRIRMEENNGGLMDGTPSDIEPPPSVPKEYALVAETNEGGVRPVTDSEFKRVAASVVGYGIADGLEPQDKVAKGEDEPDTVEKDAPPSRRERRQRAAAQGIVDAGSHELSLLDDSNALAWLKRVSAVTAARALQELGMDDPERAVALREKLDDALNSKTRLQTAELVNDNIDASCDSERTISELEGGNGEDSDFNGIPEPPKPAASRPRRAAMSAALAKVRCHDEDVELDDAEHADRDYPQNGKRNIQVAKRRKSSEPEGSLIQLPAAKGGEAFAVPEVMEAVEADNPADDKQVPTAITRQTNNSSRRSVAISSRGHTNRGRVKQKSHKSADLVEVGVLRPEKGWYNSGYIFTEGFKSRTLFRSSVALDQLCVHECCIEGLGGRYWPAPTFRVTALDRPDEPLIAKSCTGCWTAVLKRINAEIEARRRAGEDLPPPPKTAIAGPEYFGLNQPNIQEAIEDLDPDHCCGEYWAGKQERQRAAAGLPLSSVAGGTKAARAPRSGDGNGNGPSRRAAGDRRRRSEDQDSEATHSGREDDETQFMTNRWSAVGRLERYRKRLQDNGDDAAALQLDADNPLPDFIDPITLEPVVRPAISPWGHVMGAATWKAVLAENGVCPFTKKPLKWEHCRVLTMNNIDAYRDQIIR